MGLLYPARKGDELASLKLHTDLILDAAGEGIYGLDLHGRVTFANPAAAAMTGHGLDDLLGRSMHDLIHHTRADGQSYPRACCPIYAAFRDGAKRKVDSEVFWRRDGTSFPVHYTSTPIREGEQVTGAVVIFRDVTAEVRAEAELHQALDEVRRLERQLQKENALLREELDARQEIVEIIGQSAAIRQVLSAISQVAPTSTTVLLRGESGTGKELFARTIHAQSPRRDQPFIKINCGALPEALALSELFGHERGAFSGADRRRLGRFELANGGTLLLDEVAELPLELQAALLRVLQERRFERIGGDSTVRVDVRIVGTTQRDLLTQVERGLFRADLFYRLNVFPIEIPPLRDRRGDLPLLIDAFLERLSRQFERRLEGVTRSSLKRMMAHSWPGNVRELQNALHRAAVVSRGRRLDVELPPAFAAAALRASGPPGALDTPLGELERSHILATLERCHWKVAGTSGAAECLGLHPNTLRSRMKKMAIPTRPSMPSSDNFGGSSPKSRIHR